MKLSPASIVVVSKDQMASDVAGETVILGLTAGKYYGLDAVGARVWQITCLVSASRRHTVSSSDGLTGRSLCAGGGE